MEKGERRKGEGRERGRETAKRDKDGLGGGRSVDFIRLKFFLVVFLTYHQRKRDFR
jgi:hypothetical protein